MDWLEITAPAPDGDAQTVADRLTFLGVAGLVIEDEKEDLAVIEDGKKYWGGVDAGFLDSIRGVSRVKFYLGASDAGRAELARLRAALPDLGLLSRTVRDEDWENNWKKYYKPTEIGDRLLVVPEWETAPDAGGRAVMRLDPGLIFGTGSHPTTRICLEELEKLPLSGESVLDLGCGSGILAVAALLFGAKNAVGCDLDPKAPAVAAANAALNGFGPDRLELFSGDLLDPAGVPAQRLAGRRFGVVLMNIVADVVIALAPKARELLAPGGTFVCSGIIDGREDETAAALAAAGFGVITRRRMGGWNGFVCNAGGNENAV